MVEAVTGAVTGAVAELSRRCFCGQVIWPEEIHLYAATRDDPAQVAPQADFPDAERLLWIEVADDLPNCPGSADTTEAL